MSELSALGFDSSALFPCVTDKNACPFLEVDWREDPLYLRIQTSSRGDLGLTSVGMEAGTFPKLRDGERFAVHQAPELQILGRMRPPGEIWVYKGVDQANVAGAVGSLFFQEGCLGYDPAGRRLGYRPGRAELGGSSGFIHLPGVGNWSVPLTASLRFKEAPALKPVTVLCPGTRHSAVTKRFSERIPSRLIDKERSTEVVSSSGDCLRIPGLRVVEDLHYDADLGVDGIDLVLGIDVLRSGTSIFDYVTRSLFLFPYRHAM